MTASDPMDARALLAWQVAVGADEAIGETPIDRTAIPEVPPRSATPERAPSPPQPAPQPRAQSVPAAPMAQAPRVAIAGAADTRALAAACDTLEALEAAIRSFDGCALKATATNTVFADGNPQAPLMIVGEGPGAEEDRLGLPFVGASGKLLDRMLAAIGRDRRGDQTGTLITNVVYWRPPGNRTPTPGELALCLPFVQRHIALVRPKVLVFSGGTAAKTLLERADGITRFRGRWMDYRPGDVDFTVPVIATFHPSYLLRSPGQKRETWRDFLAVKHRLEALGPA